LAGRIVAWQGHESLVIGLYGDWGTGKSSVKNLITEQLTKSSDKAPHIVEFNPWIVSGEEKITQAFFHEVGCTLDQLQQDPSAKERAASWRKYARALDTASKLAGSLDLISPVFGIVSPRVGAWAAKRLQQVKELTEQAAGSLEKPPASLQEAKQELREYFEKLSKPLLVVIDDIDRLTTEEICLVFRLVKANADFPNTIYLLLFQRETAEKALDGISNEKGRDFLEKIVQVGFDLPAPTRSVLNQVLLKQLDDILEPFVQESDWEHERWVNLWVGCLSRYFTNVREVYRFLNSFTFMLTALTRKKTLEVNPIDLICIECLRVFEPAVFFEIQKHKELLTERRDDMGRQENEASANQLLELPCVDQKSVKGILMALFPSLESYWSNHNYSSEFYRGWTSKRRVCSPSFFDRYFILQLPQGQVSESTVQSILMLRENRKALRKIFGELESQGLLLATLERLESEQTLDSASNPLPYLLALADTSDGLPNTKRHMFDVPGIMLVRYAVNRVISAVNDTAHKIEIVSSIINDADCVAFSSQLLEAVTDPKEDSWYPRIEGDALLALKNSWLDRVHAFAHSGRLIEVTNLRWVLGCWMQWGDPPEARAWVASLLLDPKRILVFLAAYINESTSQSLGSYYAEDKSWISWENLERFHPRGEWAKVAGMLGASSEFSEDEKRTRKLFLAAIRRWEDGILDNNPRLFEDFERAQT
jgi:predicted KAP-like P-loop ATPase